MRPTARGARQQDNLASYFEEQEGQLALADGSRIGVIGGGPAGSFFAYFLFRMAESAGLHISVDIYEPRLFDRCGPAGCNHCGGVVSESLVQLLATEGINLPPTVVQRGIESYVLHTDVGQVGGGGGGGGRYRWFRSPPSRPVGDRRRQDSAQAGDRVRLESRHAADPDR